MAKQFVAVAVNDTIICLAIQIILKSGKICGHPKLQRKDKQSNYTQLNE